MISLIDLAGEVIIRTAGPQRVQELKDKAQPLGNGRICKLLLDSHELLRGDELIGCLHDTCLTLVWGDKFGQIEADIVLAQEACNKAKDYQAAIDKQLLQLGHAKALLERARERQMVMLKKRDHAETLLRGLDLT